MNTNFYRLFVLISLLTVLGGCATTTLSPLDCPAGTQKIAGCPPIGAIEDSDIKKLYAERSWEFSKDLQVDPFVFGRDEAIPINDAMTKFVGSTDDGAHSALAARIWMIENATHTIDVFHDVRVFHLRMRTGTEEVIIRPVTLVRGVRNTIPLIKALVGGVTPRRIAKVPLAEHSRGVARVGEHLRQRIFPLGHSVYAGTEGNFRRA